MAKNSGMGFNPGLPVPGLKTPKPQMTSLSLRPSKVQMPKTEMQASASSGKGKKEGKKKVKPPRARGQKKDTNNVFVTLPMGGDDSSSDSSSSEKFDREVKRTLFYDDSKNSPVTFDLPLADTTATMPLEPVVGARSADGHKGCKLLLNTTSYRRSNYGEGNSVDGYPVYDHYKVIYVQMAKTVMSTIRSKLIDSFTFVNFYAYINDLTYALECFYSLDAILSYTSDTDDKNSAVIELQRKLTESDVYTSQNELRRVLKGYWFPEKFSELIRWTYQLYKTSDTHQACNYMFAPNSIYLYDSPDAVISDDVITNINSIITNLGSTNANLYAKISSVLGQVYPDGVIKGLPLSSNTAHYDPQHYEVFVNQPIWWSEGAGTEEQYYPSAELGQNIVYARSCNPGQRSGMPFVLQHVLADNKSIDFLSSTYNANFVNHDYRGNKFSYVTGVGAQQGKLEWFPRNYTHFIPNESADVHSLELDHAAGAVTHKQSVPKSGFQRVYFDNATAPLINLRNFMDTVFDFV